MANKLMYIPNDGTQNYHFYRLKLVAKKFEHSNKETNQLNLTKGPKVVQLTNKKTF